MIITGNVVGAAAVACCMATPQQFCIACFEDATVFLSSTLLQLCNTLA